MAIPDETDAPGYPGIEPRWTSSAKTGVGTAMYQHLWFTISHGILNEIYFPRIDQAATRDMGMTIGDGRGWISEEKRHTNSEISYIVEGVPAYRMVNTCIQGKYRIEKQILGDPHRPALLQRVKFTALQGKLEDYKLYISLAPHLGDGGAHNTGWIAEHKGIPMLFASHDLASLALVSSAPWLKRSAGFVGVSDGFTDLEQHREMTWQFNRASDGNVALAGEIDLAACKGEFILVLGFGRNPNEAGTHARAVLFNPFKNAFQTYVAEWQEWQNTLLPLDRLRASDGKNCYRISTQVIRAHEATDSPGGMIASLSIPWGFAKGDSDTGGYHVAWPRDLVMAAGGYLAAGAHEDALRVLGFLESVQEADGHWAQCFWLDGSPYFDKVQMDETALPILLADLTRRDGALTDPLRHWPMIRKAATYLALNGPSTPQDRWEEESGYTPFTIAAVIAGLLAAADFADLNDEGKLASFFRETADAWFSNIDRWLYVTGNDWCEQYGVEGYYNRITPDGPDWLNGVSRPFFILKNVPEDRSRFRADHMVTVDAIALVRFGLRTPNDARIVNTVKVIDALLKVETPNGAAWHRYNGDGYGEKEDGSAFDDTGIGRIWPLLAGERGHYELLAGRTGQAEIVRDDMEAFANEGGMIPEQVWDTADIPEKELFHGRPTGSGNPLVWAHAEYVKLLRSLRDGKVFDLPPQTVQRYLVEKITSSRQIWSFGHQIYRLRDGNALRCQLGAAARVRWSADGWQTLNDMQTQEISHGIHMAEFGPDELSARETLEFTFFWEASDHWEGQNFQLSIEGSS